jgi:hypothetical protein
MPAKSHCVVGSERPPMRSPSGVGGYSTTLWSPRGVMTAATPELLRALQP